MHWYKLTRAMFWSSIADHKPLSLSQTLVLSRYIIIINIIFTVTLWPPPNPPNQPLPPHHPPPHNFFNANNAKNFSSTARSPLGGNLPLFNDRPLSATGSDCLTFGVNLYDSAVIRRHYVFLVWPKVQDPIRHEVPMIRSQPAGSTS